MSFLKHFYTAIILRLIAALKYEVTMQIKECYGLVFDLKFSSSDVGIELLLIKNVNAQGKIM